MRVLGLKLWRDPLTDAEYINQLRKVRRINRWLRWVNLFSAITILILSMYAISFFLKFMTTPSTPPLQQNLVYLTFLSASAFGLILGLWLAQAVSSFFSMFLNPRQERMLLECWDTLNALLDERDATDNHQPDVTGEAREG